MAKKKRTSKVVVKLERPRALGGAKSSSMMPPPFRSEVIKTHRMRYINDKQTSATVGNYTFLRGHLLNMYMTVGASGSAQRSWRQIGAIRIKSIELWCTAQTEVGYDTITLTWVGQYIPPIVLTDTGNAFRPGHIKSSPPKGSFAELWSVSAPTIGGDPEGNPLFNLVAPNFTTIDITFEMVLFQYVASGTPAQLIHPSSPLTFGTTATPPLDQNPTSTTTTTGVFTPQGVTKLLS